MKTLFRFLLLPSLLVACAVEDEPQPEPEMLEITKDEAKLLGGKADGIDYCEWLGWYGDGICDPWCPEPDPDCDDEDEGPSCEDLGGQCLSSPIDVTFGANCEADYGMITAPEGECVAFNQTCCVPEEDDGGDEEGEACGDTTCAPGLECCNASCGICVEPGGFCTQQACAPAPTSCEDAGGQCLSSPIDVTFGADCEGDFGLSTSDAECEFFNQSCCV